MSTNDRRQIAQRWDAGDIGCGPFIVGVKRRLGEMQAGERLEVTTLNAGAPSDLPAWCRMTGHTLVAAHRPIYIIEKTNH